MKQSTAVLKRSEVGEMRNGKAPVSLDGQVIGSIEQESRSFYGAFINGHAAGGGRTIENAKRSLAINYQFVR